MELYNTKFLLDRLYIELGDHLNSNKKLSIDKPEIASANKKTYINNFKIICSRINRSIDEVKNYFDKELNTPTSINQDGALVITGIFKQNGIIKVLGNYIKEYVTCKECFSCDTEIIKENRITFLKCNKCLSKKSLIG